MPQIKLILNSMLGPTLFLKPSNQIELSEKRVMNDAGAWYYEKSISDIRINCSNDKAGYEHLLAIEQSGLCYPSTLTLQVKINGEYVEKYVGSFTFRDCEYDTDNCYVVIKPTEASRYKIVEQNWEKDFNMLSVEAIATSTIQGGIAATGQAYPIRFFVTEGGATPPNTLFCGSKMQPSPPNSLWNFYVQIYAITDAIAGEPQPPDDIYTWINQTEITTGNPISDNETTEWIQSPPSALPFPIGEFTLLAGEQAGAAQVFTMGDVSGGTVGPGDPSDQYSIMISADDIVIPNGRRLSDVIKKMQELFFDGAMSIGVVGGQLFSFIGTGNSYYKDPILHQITDVKDPDANNPATKAVITFRKLMSELNKMFDAWWRIEEGMLIIDHRTAFSSNTDNRFANIKGFNRWSYDKSQLAGIRKYSTRAQRDVDFVGRNIEFSQPCANSDTEEITLELLASDIIFIRQFADDVENDIIVICSVDDNGIIYNTQGELTGSEKVNCQMSWSTLHKLFHRHNGNSATGIVNGLSEIDSQPAILDSIPIKEVKIVTQNCQLDINPYDTFTLPVGDGTIENMRTNLSTCVTEITFRV